ncbi:hypothetical protein M9H77_04010 [Catharanthus roseus]|uniref:Uncharacterized protein n=1 Tax=Catharanthus roseus TaxID=4058 RepID=A0ACC0CD58_CATRO|nr:hypothetical protein M9H77_04010 [Catharanthus roseus]
MNGDNKLETTNYIIKYKKEGCVVKNLDLLKRYFKRNKYNGTSYKKPKNCTSKYYKTCEEVLGDEEFEPIEDSEFSGSESSYELDSKELSGNLVYQKLIVTIRPNYVVSLVGKNLDRCLNLYYQLQRITMPRGSKAFSITTKIIYAYCTSHHKEIIKVGQNINIELNDEYSYIA